MGQSYLDNAATTPLHPEVIACMTAVLEQYANPSSLHSLGVEAAKAVAAARENVARLLGVSPDNLVFTSGGTEANNLAIRGSLPGSSPRGRIVTSAIEHASVAEVFKDLEGLGWDVVRLPVDSTGIIKLGALETALTKPVTLVSVMAVNNETGAIQPVAEAVALVRAKQPQAIFHCDGVQSVGKSCFQPGNDGIDLASLSAHKIFGPKGVGALYVRSRQLLTPLHRGGAQEGGLRSGTENVPGIIGFGRAAAIVKDNYTVFQARVGQLQKRFLAGLQALPCHVISPAAAVPHIVAVSFPGFKGEILLQALSAKGIYVSTGAACSGKKGEFGRIAQAMGLSKQIAEGMLRFSFSPFNTETEIDNALAKLAQVLSELDYLRGRKGR